MKNYKDYTDRVYKCITEVAKEEKIFLRDQPKSKAGIKNLIREANRKWLLSKIAEKSIIYKTNPRIIAIIYGA